MMLFQGADIIQLDTVDSTNNYAANLLKLSTVAEGTVITALEQTQGRGQRGAGWTSNAGENLLCSVILYPKSIRPDEQFNLLQTVALAVHEVVEELTQSETHIKWPNDIIVKDKKIAGILIETNIAANHLQNAIVGVGLNLNQTSFDAPNGISVSNVTGAYHDMKEVALSLQKVLAKYYARLLYGKAHELKKEYTERLYNLHTSREYVYRGEKMAAIVRGVDERGRLLLEREDTTILYCDLKEVQLVW
jgi:BirA family biotin operon repressor/biotin-[acetyl-CoA-carboxylase] ligase